MPTGPKGEKRPADVIGNAAPAIEIRATLDNRTGMRLSIADDGIGFEEKFAKEIFDPFKRLHDLKQYPGTGIGLAICKAIADRHGWTLGVRFRPAKARPSSSRCRRGSDNACRLPTVFARERADAVTAPAFARRPVNCLLA